MAVDESVSEMVRRPSRLRALASLEANAESSADALDRIARVACRMLDVPVVLVNLVGGDRQRFVGCGADEPWASVREMPLTAGFCPFALGAEDAYSLTDAREDAALAVNPAVEQFGVVAYAGVPLRAADGEPIGTLCAIDFEPRTWSPEDLAVLADLAASAIAELQLLAATRQAARQRARLKTLADLSSTLAPGLPDRDVIDEIHRAADLGNATALWLQGADPARTSEPEFLSTRAEVRDRVADMPEVASVALLPLLAGERRLGVLSIGFGDEREFSADDREYFAALAGVAALALAADRRPA
jgi:GAF domain-containing protein